MAELKACPDAKLCILLSAIGVELKSNLPILIPYEECDRRKREADIMCLWQDRQYRRSEKHNPKQLLALSHFSI